MKAKLKVMLPGFTGNMDDVVIYYNAKLNKYIARRKVTPKFVPSGQDMSEIFKLAKRIRISDAYKADCEKYINLFNRKNRSKGRSMHVWSNVFLKVMRAQKEIYPDLNYKTLTRQQILDQNLPCRSVAEAVQAGLLEAVPNYEGLEQIL